MILWNGALIGFKLRTLSIGFDYERPFTLFGILRGPPVKYSREFPRDAVTLAVRSRGNEISRYTVIRLASSKEALALSAAIISRLKEHRDKVLTKTYDNGKEFAHHKLVAEILEAEAYFAHPYHSWERGLNENTNGLIRQYFPKGIDFTTITAAQVAEVELKQKRRRRKCLDYQNPNDIFHSTPSIALAA